MPNKIKPPKGYRMLLKGERIPEHYMYCDEDKWRVTTNSLWEGAVWGPDGCLPFAVPIATKRPTRRPQPTAEECLRWLSKQKYGMADCPPTVGGHLISIYGDNGTREFTGPSLLAALRRAMKGVAK